MAHHSTSITIQLNGMQTGYATNRMRREDNRLASYQTWPAWSPAHPSLLATEGFYYSGLQDEVVCYFCGSRKKDWHVDQSVTKEHLALNPSCPIVRGTVSDNIPITLPTDTRVAEAILARLRDGMNTFDITGGFQSILETINGSTMIGNNPGRSREAERMDASGLDYGDSDRNDLPISDSSYNPLKLETERLLTFHDWPSMAPVQPQDLAQAGFYYTNTDDRVQCVFCNGILRNWEAGDVPMTEHRSHFPRCPFVRGQNVGNVPQSSVTFPVTTQQDSRAMVRAATSDPTFGEGLGIVTERPRHPEYAVEPVRVASYNNWPPNKRQRPEALSKAGFYYVGFGDNVKCFFCDGGLRNWEPSDDPWVEHAKWFSRCAYVRQCKGQDFIFSASRQSGTSSQATTVTIASRLSSPSERGGGARSRGIHHVETRQIMARLDTPTVQAVRAMGYSQDIIKRAIEGRLQTTGDDFESANSLLLAIFALEDESGGPSASTSSQHTEIGGRDASTSGANPKVNKRSTPKDASLPSTSITGEAKSLVEENRQLKEERMCKICMDQESNVVFLPCGHLVCCAQCAPAMKDCPICRSSIRGSIRTYLS